MWRINKKFAIFAIVFVVLCISIALVITYFNSTFKATITFDHVKSAEIMSVTDSAAPVKVADVAKSGDSFRLNKAQEFIVRYKGADGYSDGEVQIDKDTGTANASPDFSKERRTQLMNQSHDAVVQAITEKYPTVSSSYNINNGDVFDRGEWQVVLLQYKGDDSMNNDSLRILFKKEGNSWKRVTGAKIILTKYNTKNIDVAVLKKANDVDNPRLETPADAPATTNIENF